MPANVCLDKDRESLWREGRYLPAFPLLSAGQRPTAPCVSVKSTLLPFVSLSVLHSISLFSQPLRRFCPEARSTAHKHSPSPLLPWVSLRYTLLCPNPGTTQLVSLEMSNYQERHRGQERGLDRGSSNIRGEHKTGNPHHPTINHLP